MRLMPGAPHSLRLLKGHPFCHTQQQEEDAPLLTQLAPNHQLVPAEIMSGEELQAFKVYYNFLDQIRPSTLVVDQLDRPFTPQSSALAAAMSHNMGGLATDCLMACLACRSKPWISGATLLVPMMRYPLMWWYSVLQLNQRRTHSLSMTGKV